MAHYAFLDTNNIVVEVMPGVNENETIDGERPEVWYSNYRGMKCLRTSYNGKIRKCFAGVGYNYNESADVFYQPQLFPSWILDENFDWQPPTPYPNDGNRYTWDESSKSWVGVSDPDERK